MKEINTSIMILPTLLLMLLLSFCCCAAFDASAAQNILSGAGEMNTAPSEDFMQLTDALHRMQFIIAAIIITVALYSLMLIAGLFLLVKKRASKRKPAAARISPPTPVLNTYPGHNAAPTPKPLLKPLIYASPTTKEIKVQAAKPEPAKESAPIYTPDAETCSLFAEALRHATGADISFINCGGIRGAIDPENITESDIERIFPFGDTVTVLGLTRAQIHEVLEHSAALLPEQGGRYLYAAGIAVERDTSMPIGERVVSVTLPNDTISDSETEYIVAANDYIANGGDGYDLFAALPKITEGQTVVQAVLAYIAEVGDAGNVTSESIQLQDKQQAAV